MVVVVVAVWDRTWTFEIELCNCTKGLNPFPTDFVSCAFELWFRYAS